MTTSTCGWCRKTGLETDQATGNLEAHTMPNSPSRKSRQCNGLSTYRDAGEATAPLWHQLP